MSDWRLEGTEPERSIWRGCGLPWATLAASTMLVSLGACSSGVERKAAALRVEADVQPHGARTAVAEWSEAPAMLDRVGVVAVDETAVRVVQLPISGWVKELHQGAVGNRVRAGDPLLTLTSPQLMQAEFEFLIELAARGPVGPEAHQPEVRHGARERLQRLGLSDEEIRLLGLEQVARGELIARAPISGVVLARTVSAGDAVPAGATLLELFDSARAWVVADLYASDLSRVRAGDRGTFLAEGFPDQPFPARIEFIGPTLATKARTIKVRLRVENANGVLRPGMYGRVQLPPRRRGR